MRSWVRIAVFSLILIGFRGYAADLEDYYYMCNSIETKNDNGILFTDYPIYNGFLGQISVGKNKCMKICTDYDFGVSHNKTAPVKISNQQFGAGTPVNCSLSYQSSTIALWNVNTDNVYCGFSGWGPPSGYDVINPEPCRPELSR